MKGTIRWGSLPYVVDYVWLARRNVQEHQGRPLWRPSIGLPRLDQLGTDVEKTREHRRGRMQRRAHAFHGARIQGLRRQRQVVRNSRKGRQFRRATSGESVLQPFLLFPVDFLCTVHSRVLRQQRGQGKYWRQSAPVCSFLCNKCDHEPPTASGLDLGQITGHSFLYYSIQVIILPGRCVMSLARDAFRQVDSRR